MIITEPMTLLTDSLIAGEAIGFAVLLFNAGRSRKQMLGLF
jgi:hypothetical protein